MGITQVYIVLGGLLGVDITLVVGVCHGPWWVAGALGYGLLVCAWITYLHWQVRHPEWWAPWDEGLPQVMRMMNAFVPIAIVFTFFLVLAPAFISARQKMLWRRHHHHGIAAAVAPRHAQSVPWEGRSTCYRPEDTIRTCVDHRS
ncbi:MAG: hypothetical protein ACLQVD_03980 [Capsulimonadaceae bacterium]